MPYAMTKINKNEYRQVQSCLYSLDAFNAEDIYPPSMTPRRKHIHVNPLWPWVIVHANMCG